MIEVHIVRTDEGQAHFSKDTVYELITLKVIEIEKTELVGDDAVKVNFYRKPSFGTADAADKTEPITNG